VLVDAPNVYGLPEKPELASANVGEGFAWSGVAAAALAVTGMAAFRKNRMDEIAAAEPTSEGDRA
jgi:hypothetical protein